MFRKESGICDWHPDYTCVRAGKKYSPAIPAKSKTSWPSKEELAERQQAVIDGTDCGI
jgi:hypothetical protein